MYTRNLDDITRKRSPDYSTIASDLGHRCHYEGVLRKPLGQDGQLAVSDQPSQHRCLPIRLNARVSHTSPEAFHARRGSLVSAFLAAGNREKNQESCRDRMRHSSRWEKGGRGKDYAFTVE